MIHFFNPHKWDEIMRPKPTDGISSDYLHRIHITHRKMHSWGKCNEA